jgi:hypothetical protein
MRRRGVDEASSIGDRAEYCPREVPALEQVGRGNEPRSEASSLVT